MKKYTIIGAMTAIALIAIVAGHRALHPGNATPVVKPVALTESPAEGEASGFLHGRVTTYDGTTYEGRLRWGRDEEAFWGNYFNGVRDENPWAGHAPRRPIEILGVRIARGARPRDLERPFMVRFGDIVRIEARGDGLRGLLESGLAFDPDVRVTLKSGAVVDLDRLEASDFDDGVRVWDDTHGIVRLGPGQIHTIELFPAPRLDAVPERLHGTVRTREGTFTGFLQWDREEAVGSDEITGHTDEGELRLRFDEIGAIARHSRTSARVTLRDGREIVLSGTRKAGEGNRGLYVDDPRYGRVLVSWDAFERVDFKPAGSGPAYDDFPPGRPLTGRVTTRDGRSLAGRLVFDLDESETIETLDAPWRGVDYTIPFGLISAVVLPGDEGQARVLLQRGEELLLERSGDLGAENAGMLVFGTDGEQARHVPWADVARIDFDRPPAMYPPIGKE